ncbi:Aldehyde/histidinol dehydrogenase [Amylocarpus encephaloides]|uniref:Aldehyde/histidinol dehydrogenase n=1 Tax=Amylocarpus encephaloides TaxID=45428 RepID=A0A9P7YJR9_9HELO|nr:Aldehyde/histidinol dehydrogenase [Amylocarpus encephaloides]
MSLTVPLIINGQEIQTSTTFDVVNPATLEVLWKSSTASVKDAAAAADAAQAAFPAWASTKPAARRNILIKAAEIFESRSAQYSEYMNTETGSTPDWADNATIPSAWDMIRDTAGRIITFTSTVPVMRDESTHGIIYKEPYGVVLGIAPWNCPYHLGIRAIIFALATGNTVILKGSELSPRCFWSIVSVFQEAGLPDGVLNFLTCRPEDAAATTKALIEHPAVRKVNFTGSTHIGRIVASLCGQNIKPCLLELGGKAGAIVFEDADIQNAAFQCAIGAFLHSGQICMATEKLIVHKSIAPAFGNALAAIVGQIFAQSHPAPVCVTKAGPEKNHRLVSDALSKGASLLVGNTTKEESATRMRPIVVEGVTSNMDIYSEESFGPTVSLITFETEAEAIKLINDTEYGLSAAVFTKNLDVGLRVARSIESGAVHINKMTVFDDPSVPHGGVKSSGYGRFNGDFGLAEFLKTKSVTWTSGS